MATTSTYRALSIRNLDKLPQVQRLPASQREALRVVSAVLPFRTNQYVVDELIDWDAVPDDPIFRLTFPQAEMLSGQDYRLIDDLQRSGAGPETILDAARGIQRRLNPHPAGQLDLNVPQFRGRALRGIQHKYPETVLFFPSQGQTCHAFCTYCFRWPQFVGLEDLKFAASEAGTLVDYVAAHPEVTSVLFTGGDPLIMKTATLRKYIEPLLAADLPNVASIRLGTKSLAYWPQRFVTDPDADDLLRLFEEVVASGRTLAFMAHFSHPRELETPLVRRAIERIRATGAVIRCQAPLARHINDDAKIWSTMWLAQVRLGMVPYYMFVERDTGPRAYFEVPLMRAWQIYRDAVSAVSGLARTVRGPSMSATPGKVVIDGVTEVGGETVFALRFLQARNPAWVGRPFFAAYDPAATWLDQLRPARWEREFFFAAELRALKNAQRSQPLQLVDAPPPQDPELEQA